MKTLESEPGSVRQMSGAFSVLCALVWIGTAAAHAPEAHDSEGCRCAENQALDGWCSECRVGYFAGVRIESAELIEVLDLHGHDVNPEKTRCPTCRERIASGGFCDACQMGFINGKGYFSHLCYAMAKGRVVGESTGPPPRCLASDGWCDRCSRGRVANRVFSRHGDFIDAQRWLGVLKAAVAKAGQCEVCAGAMIANGGCFRCRVAYKDGKVAPDQAVTRVSDAPTALPGKEHDPTELTNARRPRSVAEPARSEQAVDAAQKHQ